MTVPPPPKPRNRLKTAALPLTWPSLFAGPLGRDPPSRAQPRRPAGNPPDRRPAKMVEHHERVVGQLKYLVDAGAVHRALPRRLAERTMRGRNVAGFEELVTADPSLQMKAGVQCGPVWSRRAAPGRCLPDIMSLKTPTHAP